MWPALILAISSALVALVSWWREKKGVTFIVLLITLASALASLADKYLSNEDTATIEKLEHALNDLNTGGDSGYLRLEKTSAPGAQSFTEKVNGKDCNYPQILIRLVNRGDFALDDVKITCYDMLGFRIMDAAFFGRQIAATLNNFNFFAVGEDELYQRNMSQDQVAMPKPAYEKNYNTFNPGQSVVLPLDARMLSHGFLGYDIIVQSKKQDWAILLRGIRRVSKFKSEYVLAYQIFKITGRGLRIIETKVDPEYPREPDGSVRWFNGRIRWYWHIEPRNSDSAEFEPWPNNMKWTDP